MILVGVGAVIAGSAMVLLRKPWSRMAKSISATMRIDLLASKSLHFWEKWCIVASIAISLSGLLIVLFALR